MVLALARVAEGGRVIGVEPNTTVGKLLVDVLGPALADRPPMPSLYLRPIDLRGGIGLPRISRLGARQFLDHALADPLYAGRTCGFAAEILPSGRYRLGGSGSS